MNELRVFFEQTPSEWILCLVLLLAGIGATDFLKRNPKSFAIYVTMGIIMTIVVGYSLLLLGFEKEFAFAAGSNDAPPAEALGYIAGVVVGVTTDITALVMLGEFIALPTFSFGIGMLIGVIIQIPAQIGIGVAVLGTILIALLEGLGFHQLSKEIPYDYRSLIIINGVIFVYNSFCGLIVARMDKSLKSGSFFTGAMHPRLVVFAIAMAALGTHLTPEMASLALGTMISTTVVGGIIMVISIFVPGKMPEYH